MADLKERIEKLVEEFEIPLSTPTIKFNKVKTRDEGGTKIHDATFRMTNKTLAEGFVGDFVNLEYWNQCGSYINDESLNQGGDFGVRDANKLNNTPAIRIYTDGIYFPSDNS